MRIIWKASALLIVLLLLGCPDGPRDAATSAALPNRPNGEHQIEALRKQAGEGLPDAQNKLGVAYASGEGVPKDHAKAADWYRKAAEQGYASAQYNLGESYLVGDGVPKDVEKAAAWIQKAAAQGNASAQNRLGGMYHTGVGVPKDFATAFEWAEKAAAQGLADAQHNLGFLYSRGDGVPKDAAKAVEWYQKAAAQGHTDAQLNLGDIYYHGKGVPKDVAKALEWYRKAAAQGDASAQLSLGLMHANGEGVPKDAAKAVEWFQKAAAQGQVAAQLNLGERYRAGAGIPLDTVLAYAWFNLAASSGEETAVKYGAEWRGNVERLMSAAEIAEAQRLSSNWKKGQILVREGRSVSPGASQSATPGSLSKKKTGTLFLVNPTGQAITNHHVVAGCEELRVESRDGLARVVTEDVVNDLALVQIPGESKGSAAITAEPGRLRQGEDIVVFGFPLNAVLSTGGNLTPGVVSALTGLGNNTNQIQITAPIQPGSSGSPVVNKKGEVVGVVSQKLSDSKLAAATGQVGQNVNFAVNGQTLRTFLDIHKVSYRSGGGFFSREMSTADLAAEMRKWTLVVECWK